MIGVQVPPSACHAGTRDVEAAWGESDLHGFVEHSRRHGRSPQDRGGRPTHDGADGRDSERRVNEINCSRGLARQSDSSMRRPPFAVNEVLPIVSPNRTGSPEVP